MAKTSRIANSRSYRPPQRLYAVRLTACLLSSFAAGWWLIPIFPVPRSVFFAASLAGLRLLVTELMLIGSLAGLPTASGLPLTLLDGVVSGAVTRLFITGCLLFPRHLALLSTLLWVAAESILATCRASVQIRAAYAPTKPSFRDLFPLTRPVPLVLLIGSVLLCR